jgi:hypothetical protein
MLTFSFEGRLHVAASNTLQPIFPKVLFNKDLYINSL